MSINKAENGLDDRVIRKLTDHDRAIREIKSAVQPIGGDSIKVGNTGLLFGGPLALTSGSAGTFNVTITPAQQTLTLWNFLFTVLVDGTTVDDRFPNGLNMTTAKRNVRVYRIDDWVESNDTTNVRVVKIRVENYDAASHNYYLWFKGYFPALAGTTAS